MRLYIVKNSDDELVAIFTNKEDFENFIFDYEGTYTELVI